MNKKEVVWVVLVFAGLITAGIVFFAEGKINEKQPTTWIIAETPTRASLNVEGATGGKASLDDQGIQYLSASIGTVFSLEGWYEGNYFKEKYQDQEGRTRMRISNDFQPEDGIPEGFIIVKPEFSEIFVFVDEDWKKQYPDSAIYWGRFYENEKEFNFSTNVDGIYIDSVRDDPGRFKSNYNIHEGGVWLGILNEDETSTLIQLT